MYWDDIWNWVVHAAGTLFSWLLQPLQAFLQRIVDGWHSLQDQIRQWWNWFLAWRQYDFSTWLIDRWSEFIHWLIDKEHTFSIRLGTWSWEFHVRLSDWTFRFYVKLGDFEYSFYLNLQDWAYRFHVKLGDLEWNFWGKVREWEFGFNVKLWQWGWEASVDLLDRQWQFSIFLRDRAWDVDAAIATWTRDFGTFLSDRSREVQHFIQEKETSYLRFVDGLTFNIWPILLGAVENIDLTPDWLDDILATFPTPLQAIEEVIEELDDPLCALPGGLDYDIDEYLEYLMGPLEGEPPDGTMIVPDTAELERLVPSM